MTVVRPHGKAIKGFDIAVPNFARDLNEVGRPGEELVARYLSWLSDRQAEVKTKRYIDLELYVETHHDPGRRGIYQPSGISTTTASVWAYVIDRQFITIFLPTELLRAMLTDPATKDREERDGDCPTRGKLINFGVVLLRLKQQLQAPIDPAVIVQPSATDCDHRRFGIIRADLPCPVCGTK